MIKQENQLMTLEICEEHVDHPTEKLNINQEASKQQDELECGACEFKCKSEITLRKHANTKHPIQITHIDRDTSNDLKCVLCEDKSVFKAPLMNLRQLENKVFKNSKGFKKPG